MFFFGAFVRNKICPQSLQTKRLWYWFDPLHVVRTCWQREKSSWVGETSETTDHSPSSSSCSSCSTYFTRPIKKRSISPLSFVLMRPINFLTRSFVAHPLHIVHVTHKEIRAAATKRTSKDTMAAQNSYDTTLWLYQHSCNSCFRRAPNLNVAFIDMYMYHISGLVCEKIVKKCISVGCVYISHLWTWPGGTGFFGGLRCHMGPRLCLMLYAPGWSGWWVGSCDGSSESTSALSLVVASFWWWSESVLLFLLVSTSSAAGLLSPVASCFISWRWEGADLGTSCLLSSSCAR